MSVEPMSPERRQEIERSNHLRGYDDGTSQIIRDVEDLLAEVDRLQTELAKFQADGWVQYEVVDGFMEATFHEPPPAAALRTGEQPDAARPMPAEWSAGARSETARWQHEPSDAAEPTPGPGGEA